MNIINAIQSLRPNVGFVMHEENIAEIEWDQEGIEPLTAAEVQDEIKRLETVEAERVEAEANARAAAVAHAKSLGFTEEMIAVMYPNLAPSVP